MWLIKVVHVLLLAMGNRLVSAAPAAEPEAEPMAQDPYRTVYHSPAVYHHPTAFSEPIYHPIYKPSLPVYQHKGKTLVLDHHPNAFHPSTVYKPAIKHFKHEPKYLKHEPVHVHHEPVHVKHEPVHIKHEPVHIKHEPVHIKHEPVHIKHEKAQAKHEPIHIHEPVFVHHHHTEPVHNSLYHDEPVYVQEASYHPAPVYKPKTLYKPATYDHHHEDDYKHEPKPYAFDYGVKDDYTGANFGHSEKSDGKNVQGSYSVALPDGRIQHVKYVADHYNGFQAEVTYEGEAHYPEYHGPPYIYKPQPGYHKSYDPYL